MWSLEPGECIVAEELTKQLPECEFFFPLRDVGSDLLVVRKKSHIRIQVKESRYYFGKRSIWPSGHIGHSWHQIKEQKLQENPGQVDFFVFLTYLPVVAEHKVNQFEYKYLVVPMEEVIKRLTIKRPSKVYSFCFHFEENRVWDERVKARAQCYPEVAQEHARCQLFL